MGPTSLLLWSSCLLLTLFSSPAVGAQIDGWCPPENPLKGCPASVDNIIVKITVDTEAPEKNTCEGPTGNTDDCTDDYKGVKDSDTCKGVCDPTMTPECTAYTYVTERGDLPDLCYLLTNCDETGNIDLDNIPCQPPEKCSGEVVCQKTECDVNTPNSCDVGQCAGGVCEVYCITPSGLNHDYSKPEKRHWQAPCRLSEDRGDDADCNIYFNDKKCQDGTVCTLPECGTDPEVKHTCVEGKWIVGDPTLGNPVTQWEETICLACGTLTIKVEPGLSLFCKKESEQTADPTDKVYTIVEGPCDMYCNGILIHHIYCDTNTKKWTGDEGVEHEGGLDDTFYCWEKPSP